MNFCPKFQPVSVFFLQGGALQGVKFESFCKLKHRHCIEMRENQYTVIQLHGTVKHKMMLVHSDVIFYATSLDLVMISETIDVIMHTIHALTDHIS